MAKPPLPTKPALPAKAVESIPAPVPAETPAAPIDAGIPISTNDARKNQVAFFTFPAYILKAVSLFASQDDTRKAVHCVFMDLKTGAPILIATDGRAMCRYMLDPTGKEPEVTRSGYLPDGVEGFMIPLSLIQISAGVSGKHSVTVSYGHDTREVYVTGPNGETLTAKPEVAFPNWRQVWPKDWKPVTKACTEFALGWPLMATLAAAVKILILGIHGKGYHARSGIKILPAGDETEPVRITLPLFKNHEVFQAVLMPVRLD